MSIEDLKDQIITYKDQIVAYKKQLIKDQYCTDALLDSISKDVEYIRANMNNNKNMYDNCAKLIISVNNTLLDYINKAGQLAENTTQRLVSIINVIGYTRGDINAVNDKITDIGAVVNRINDNTTPKTKIKAKNSSKKSE